MGGVIPAESCLDPVPSCYHYAYEGAEVISLEPQSNIPEVHGFPFPTDGAVGLLDKLNRPVVCGGQYELPHNCYTYVEDTWTFGGLMTVQKRFHAVSVRVPDGSYWVIGGTGPA